MKEKKTQSVDIRAQEENLSDRRAQLRGRRMKVEVEDKPYSNGGTLALQYKGKDYGTSKSSMRLLRCVSEKEGYSPPRGRREVGSS